MSSVAVRNNLSTFIDALLAGDTQALTRTAEEVISRAEDASELLGRLGLIAMHGDSDGHTVLTLSAASVLARWLIALRHTLGEDEQGLARGIPLVIQAAQAAAPAVRAGLNAPRTYPDPLFPSGLPENTTVGAALSQASRANDTTEIERLLLGLYGTGADYRTISIRIYDSIAQTFQENGHTLQFAARGSQVLDAVEWGEDTPDYIHWLSPHLTQKSAEPEWIQDVHGFLSESHHSLQSYRTRLAAPRNEQALPLRALILSNASTPQVLQGVYDALITNGASARAVGSVIALAAADIVQSIGDEQYENFIQAAHGLLFASAARLTYTQVQEVEGLPLLFTAAAYVHALRQESGAAASQAARPRPGIIGGGLIAPALLESIRGQLEAQDVSAALATSRRYIQLEHDAHALCATIGLHAARADAAADQGHSLQIVQAASDEYVSWPKELPTTDAEIFLQVALRTAALAGHNSSSTTH